MDKLYSLQTFLIYVLLVIIPSSFHAQSRIFSGYVEDATSGEKLIGATVFLPEWDVGTLTNNYGFFSIQAESDTLTVQVNYLGYENYRETIVLRGDSSVSNRVISLTPIDISLEKVEINAEESMTESTEMGTIHLPIETIKDIPPLMGEVDVIKALQLLPGVQSGTEGASGMYVRGGGADQNLILLDGVPLYNVQHLFGFFSIFNADALKNVKLIKGGFPARYGGRLSSVLDISMKEGNTKELHGEGSLGLIAAKMTLEGPIKSEKTSFLLSGRRTYLDLIARPFFQNVNNGEDGGYHFYDLNAKINHKFSDKDRIFLSGYFGRDKFSSSNKEVQYDGPDKYTSNTGFKLAWGNAIAALRWNHLYSSRLFGNLTLTHSRYNMDVGAEYEESVEGPAIDLEEFSEARYQTNIRDWGAKADYDFFASPQHLMRFGAYATYHQFTPGVTRFQSVGFGQEAYDSTYGSSVINTLEFGGYFEDEFSLGDRFKANAGVHLNGFLVKDKLYGSVQPRFSSRLMLAKNWSAKGAFATMSQNLHLLTNSNVGPPTDLWVPATETIKPQTAWIASLGLNRNFSNLGLEFSLEGYYKYMYNVIAYKEGASFLSIDQDWQEKVVVGDGWSYGLEGLLQRKKGKTTGWIGYTLSWANRQFSELNNGLPFPYKYDRRHDLSLVLNHKLNDRIDFGLTYVYGTGYALTLPEVSIPSVSPSPISEQWLNQFDVVTARNNYRVRDYHRLDFGVNFTKERPKWTRTWSVGAYNVYSRKNPFFLYWANEDFTSRRSLRQVSLFPVLPYVTYKFKF